MTIKGIIIKCKRLIAASGFFLLAAMVASPIKALPITTAQIIPQTLGAVQTLANPENCLRHSQLSGQRAGDCIFVTFPGGVQRTELVEHYTPDSVIRVHNYDDQDAWIDHVDFPIPTPGISGNAPATEAGKSELLFKHVAANGNPLTSRFKSMLEQATPSQFTFCSSAARSFFFQYDSSKDITWSKNPFRILALLPVELGILGVDSWGHAFNLDGWSNNTHPGKGAALVAKRATLVVTGSIFDLINFFRVANRIPKFCEGLGCHTFGARFNSASPAMEQALSPFPGLSCGALGPTILPTSTNFDLNIEKIPNPQQQQVYNEWHCYKCCEPPKGGIIIAGPLIIPKNPFGCGLIP